MRTTFLRLSLVVGIGIVLLLAGLNHVNVQANPAEQATVPAATANSPAQATAGLQPGQSIGGLILTRVDQPDPTVFPLVATANFCKDNPIVKG